MNNLEEPILKSWSFAILIHLGLIITLIFKINLPKENEIIIQTEIWNDDYFEEPKIELNKVTETVIQKPSVVENKIIEADINLEKEKIIKELEILKNQQELELKLKLENDQKLAKQKKLEEQRIRELETEKQAKIEEEQRKKEQENKERQEFLNQQRAKNLKRLQGLANPNNISNSSSNKFSDNYASIVASKVRSFIIYPELINDSSQTKVQVKTDNEGNIIDVKIINSSGNLAWDNAVLRALEKTKNLPKDVNDRIPSVFEFTFKASD